MAQIFRLKNWTHYEPKPAKRNTPGVRSAGFNARPGRHTVVMVIGDIAEGAPLTDEWLVKALRENGLALDGEVEAPPVAAKLLALLDSEEPPLELAEMILTLRRSPQLWKAETVIAQAWRWLREQVHQNRTPATSAEEGPL